LLRAAEVLEDPELLAWAGTALASLDRQLRTTGGYRHALLPEGPAELEGYLPAQVWPAIAWHLYARTRDPATHDRTQEHLEWIARYYH
ncbi:hypothetical protein, partial [Klebsiella pneumoniae]|uniref:hypothetical protein n=1 Tax=Klebsiella pneumoniae TaxID=573 RepID=UPI00272FE3CE